MLSVAWAETAMTSGCCPSGGFVAGELLVGFQPGTSRDITEELSNCLASSGQITTTASGTATVPPVTPTPTPTRTPSATAPPTLTPSTLDLSGFNEFHFERTHGLGFCPPLDAVYAASLHTLGGRYTLDMSILVEGQQAVDSCVPTLPSEVDCATIRTLPPRALTDSEIQSMREVFGAVRVFPESDAICRQFIVDPCLINTASWDTLHLQDYVCSGGNRMDADQVSSIGAFLEELRSPSQSPAPTPTGATPPPTVTPTSTPTEAGTFTDTPTPPTSTPTAPSPTCIAEWAWLSRELPEEATAGVPFTVRYNLGGGTAVIRRIEETVPIGWQVLSPPWSERSGQTYTWNDVSLSYPVFWQLEVLPPADLPDGDYPIYGETTSWHSCNGERTLAIEGDHVIHIRSESTTCGGDCDGGSTVSVDEIITMVNIALSALPAADCTAGDANQDGAIAIDEILTAVNNALNGCAAVCGTVACPRGEYCCNPLLSICTPPGMGCIQ
jgi:hypothetical protein